MLRTTGLLGFGNTRARWPLRRPQNRTREETSFDGTSDCQKSRIAPAFHYCIQRAGCPLAPQARCLCYRSAAERSIHLIPLLRFGPERWQRRVEIATEENVEVLIAP